MYTHLKEKKFFVSWAVYCVAVGLESYLCLDAAAGWNRAEGSGCSGERLGCLGEWKDRDPETGG